MEIQTSGDGATTAVPTPPRPRVLTQDEAEQLAGRPEPTEKPAEAPAVAAVREWYAKDFPDSAIPPETMGRKYAAFLAAFEAAPAAPEWLRGMPEREEGDDVTCPADTVTLARSESDSEAVDRMLAAVTALLRTREFVDFSTALDSLPTSRYANPRLGLVQLQTVPRSKPKTAHDLPPLPDHERYVACSASGQVFVWPTAAAVPALVFDLVDPDGAVVDEVVRAVHPALVASGPEFVLEAMWQHGVYGFMGLVSEVTEHLEDLTMVLGLDPATVGRVPLDRAVSARRPVLHGQGPERGAGGFGEGVEPRGWRETATYEVGY